ncbi:DUF1648 domain-containing protein [Sporosarcina sp. PTS2304]|uniref:DUF1648 domain-containing protein n=1 Tax=Sporosarcina sp. PTS2304 TaxID=2283194 RepID=UPI000E0CCDD6|nr:DUF1648 domain-containing protein [Sporosarcina sp. PTS2304]AXI00877.1 DUF1648 domain-containing protein [Sporosarcina sp. PTS2304]
MAVEKPKRNLPKSNVAKVFDVLVIALFAACLTYLALHWNQMPDQIPAHFGLDGEVDRYGSKAELLLLPLIGIALWIGLSVLEKYPHTFNYINLRADNIDVQYRYGMLFMNATKNISTLLMVFIMWQMNGIALGQIETLNMPVFIGILVLLFAVVGFYFVRVMKL